MEKQKKKQNGITLIALVISIIVMLILAGVSLNMTVGDNGIIKQAQNATIQSSVALLQDYFDQEYVRNYEKYESYAYKIEGFTNSSEFSDWFWSPAKHGIGAMDCVITKNGNACYFLDKENLPSELRDNVKGGDANTYEDYFKMIDCYGVTKDLKVYYCSDGLDSVIGLKKDNIDKDNPSRIIFSDADNSGFYENFSEYDSDGDGKLSIKEIRGIKDVELSSSNIKSLEKIYNFSSLEKLTLKNLNLKSLDGIENCPLLKYIYIDSSTIEDYSSLKKVNNRLAKLYLYNVDDDEANRCTIGMAETTFDKLLEFGIVGITKFLDSPSSKEEPTAGSSTRYITTLEFLSNLNEDTKAKIRFLSFNNEKIGDRTLNLSAESDLSYLSGFSNLYCLRIEYNNITSLKGIGSLIGLNMIVAAGNKLGADEIYDSTIDGYGADSSKDSLVALGNLNSLDYLDLRSNTDLKFTKYLASCSSLHYLYLNNDKNLKDVDKIKTLYNGIDTNKKYIDPMYELDLLDVAKTKSLDLNGQTLTYSNLDSIGSCSLLYRLRLDGITLKDNSGALITGTTFNTKINDMLKKLKGMQYLSLRNLSNLSTLDFIGNNYISSIVELDLYGTSITDLKNLNSNSSSLYSLILNNQDIKLSEINTAIVNIMSHGFHCSWDPGSNYWFKRGSGLIIFNKSGYTGDKQKLLLGLEDIRLGNVTLSAIGGNAFVPYEGKSYLDLSNISTATSAYIYDSSFGYNVKLPFCLTSINLLGRS